MGSGILMGAKDGKTAIFDKDGKFLSYCPCMEDVIGEAERNTEKRINGDYSKFDEYYKEELKKAKEKFNQNNK